MNLRVVTIARQDVMTRDNVPMTVDAVVYFRVIDPAASVVRAENYLKATLLIAQTTLRSGLGQAELDELLFQRDKINLRLQEIIDRQTDPWGIKVTAVEVRDVVLPDSMKRTMAGRAESERERQAKIINAEGEFQAAQKLVQAASMISAQFALQLRFLQTMKEISSEHNTTTILPVPIDLFAPFIKRSESQTPKEP
jgi:regulator of protease activity HflC (stomatin/prohibitin superfamily)